MDVRFGGEKVDVLCLGWWADGGPLLTLDGVREVFDVLAESLPEAVPSRWDVDESFRHRLDQEGLGALVEFVDRYRDAGLSGVCLRAKAPARAVTLTASDGRRGVRPVDGVFEAVHFSVELGTKMMARRGAGDRLALVFERIAIAMDVFYAEARWLHGVGGGHVMPSLDDGEVYPFEWNHWFGLPVKAPSVAALGRPYRELWPDFGDRELGALRLAGPRRWTAEMAPLSWPVPDGLAQPFDRHWKVLTAGGSSPDGGSRFPMQPGTAFELTVPSARSAAWPLSERAAVRAEPSWDLGLEEGADPEAVRWVTDDDPDGEAFESWERISAQPDLRAVWITRTEAGASWSWSVTVSAMEFVRGGTDEADLRRRMHEALRAVTGVSAVAEEDREVWLVQGTPNGRELITAAVGVIDSSDDILRRATQA